MSNWVNQQLQIFNPLGQRIYHTANFYDAEGNTAWHEIGRGASATLPFIGTGPTFLFTRGNRVYVTVYNSAAATTHIICDFIVESSNIEEITLANGALATAVKATGRDWIKTLGEFPTGLRHLSKYRPLAPMTAIGKTTIQMSAANIAATAGLSLIGWTAELADGNWSEITEHTAGGLLTIDPAWQVNVDDEDAAAPPVQKWSVYGAAFTETTGTYTDLKLAFLNMPSRYGWGIHSQSLTSTREGSFLSPGKEASVLKVLQQIAAQSGEYFVRVPGESRIQWRREVPPATHASYGYPLRLVVPEDGQYDPFQEAVILPGATYRADASNVVTRVRPVGGGSGDKALTLKDLPPGWVGEPGYSIDGEYLVYDAGETGDFRIAKDLRFEGISPASDSDVSRYMAAAGIYRAAYLWMLEHNDVQRIVECEVLSSIPIYPVTYVYVDHPDYALGGNKPMYVLDSTVTYRDDRVIYKLQLSDKKAPIMTDERIMALAIRQTDTQIFYTNAPARNSRSLDRSANSSGGGSSHEPVTAGNAGIGVAPGQVLTLVLAAPSGLEVADIGLRLADSVAGNGLAISNKSLSINLAAHSGLQIVGDGLGLGLPGGLSADTGNQVNGNTHYHFILTTNNAKTTPGQILKTTPTGDLTLHLLTADDVVTPRISSTGAIMLDPATNLIYADGNLSFIGARQIVTDTGSLTLRPAQTLIFDPTDNLAQVHTDVTLKSSHAAVGVFPQTGWQINYNGAGYFTSLQADELHVQSFIADIMRVKVGGEYIPESMALISRDVTIPAVGSSTTLYVEDIPGWANIGAFADNDWVLLRIVDRSGGGLTVANAWGQVTNYTDLSGGEQSYTFTTRIATNAVMRKARRGDLALDYGKSGSSWWYVTVLDRTGPHAGFGTWQGNNPTEGISYPVRLGQLHGVTGVNEMGFQAGASLSSRTRISNLRNEIFGSRFSLFAGDGAQLRVAAADVLFYTTASVFQTLVPNADHSSLNAATTGATYYQTIDEGTTAPVLSDYVANGANTAGYVMVGLSNPAAFSSIYQIKLKFTLVGAGFVNDTIRLFAQVFQDDEITPLTGEVLVQSRSSNAGSIAGTVTFPHHNPTATTTEWNGARLRLRWEYDINANEEAIRLDPAVPSIAVGNPLPTGPAAGGDGFWVGHEAGLYKLRLGAAVGVGLDWTGTTLQIRNSANTPVISLLSNGTSEFAAPMTLGAAGGIWQAAGGSFAAPVSGFKLYNAAGKGRFEMYPASGSPVVLDENGLSIPTRTTPLNGLKNVNEIAFLHSYLGANYKAGGLQGYGQYAASMGSASTRLYVTNRAGTATRAYIEAYHYEEGAANTDTLTLNSPDAIQMTAEFVRADARIDANQGIRALEGIVVGDSALLAIPQPGVFRLSQRADNNTYPDSTQVDLFARTVGGVQKLYAKFGNGVVRELASAT